MLTKTGFLRSMQSSHLLFQLFGLSTKLLTAKPNFLLAILLKCYVISITALILYTTVYKYMFEIIIYNTELSKLFDQILFLSICIAHLVTLTEVIFKSIKEATIVRNFYHIECMIDLFAAGSGIRINLDRIRSRYAWKGWSTFFIILFVKINGMLPFILVAWRYQRFLLFSWTSLQIRMLQVNLVIDQLSDFTETLTKLLAGTTSAPKDQHVERVSTVADIYSCIRETNVLINETFSWSLVTIMLQYMIAMTNFTYWTMFNISVTHSLRISWSK